MLWHYAVLSQETEPRFDLTASVDAMARLDARRHQMILEALREIDEGQVVSHEEIEKWAASVESLAKTTNP